MPFHEPGLLYVSDIDGDGDDDLIVGAYDERRLAVYERNDQGGMVLLCEEAVFDVPTIFESVSPTQAGANQGLMVGYETPEVELTYIPALCGGL